MAQLFIVSTPIGNLQDITLRAIHVLRMVDVIACEDTRHSLALLNAHGISKALISCHAHNERTATDRICLLLHKGKDIAFICDAGTPGISDPGHYLVRRVRDEGFNTIPIPGPSVITALLSISGFSAKRILFEGFLSPKNGKRKKQLRDLIIQGESFIIFESPFRVLKLLNSIEEVGEQINDHREILCGRELTKLHEEVLEGKAADIRDILAERASIKGEFVFLISALSKRT